ncbi:iron ABC transporter permease [Glaciecola sp. XM2]|uniref:FecCD family ABC transporter permease n=1 Tax=Glaciecola sp. XM2 TaxID=1914931 RepID=UPI002032D3D2|nr:iron ABC transporter permease [Glaciecola sp. XM2]
MHQANRFTLIYLGVLCVLAGVYLLPPSLTFNELERYILVHLKLPVLITAITVGASIAAASAALQVLLRNPLADPGIIGISSGASLFAAAFILLSGTSLATLGLSPEWQINVYALPVLCFVGALLSSLLIFKLAKWMGGSISSVILSGIAISTVCSALVGWMFLVAPPTQLQSLTFWLMGSLNNTTWLTLAVAGPLALVATAFLLRCAGPLNQMYLGEQTAQLSGVDVKRFNKRMLVLIALLVGISVSIAGSIAFLGLLVPHFIRRLHGNDNRMVLLLSAFVGASVMIMCAIINSHFASITLPISMLTATIGAPLFIYVLSRKAF